MADDVTEIDPTWLVSFQKDAISPSLLSLLKAATAEPLTVPCTSPADDSLEPAVPKLVEVLPTNRLPEESMRARSVSLVPTSNYLSH